MENEVTAIVPCFNEETRVGAVVKALSNSPLIDKLIIIDDASTDGSRNVIESFKNQKILIIKNQTNLGKGGAVRKGLDYVTTPITFLCDADIAGINNKEIEKIIIPVKSDEVDACIGILFRGKFLQFFRRHMTVITGERVIKTEILRKVMESPYTERWGIEFYMNFYFRHHNIKTKIVDLKVDDFMQMKKIGFIRWIYARPILLGGIILRIFFLEVKTFLGMHE